MNTSSATMLSLILNALPNGKPFHHVAVEIRDQVARHSEDWSEAVGPAWLNLAYRIDALIGAAEDVRDAEAEVEPELE
jgi:hypothetical protein